MSVIRFGLYLIPDGDLYSLGSNIVGYDIRCVQKAPRPKFIKEQWVEKATVFGFHMTVTDALEIEESKLPAIMQEVEKLISCLKRDNIYQVSLNSIGFWNRNSPQAAIRVIPNRPIEVLHDVLVSRIHPLALESEYSRDLRKLPKDNILCLPSSRVAKTQHFLGPYIFDEFQPHFTCLSNFSGDSSTREQTELFLVDYFKEIDKKICLKKLALVTKTEADNHFIIAHEFSL